MPRLPHDAVGARRIDRPQNRADIVRILDPVEHDDERRALRARSTRSATSMRVGSAQLGDHALVHAAARSTIELGRRRRARTGSAGALGRVARDRSRAPPARAPTRSSVTRPARSASSTGLMP